MRLFKALSLMVLGMALMLPQPAQASKIQKAIDAYLKGQKLSRSGKYRSALRAFEKAYRYVPRLPRFNCRRSTFLQYQGSMLVKIRRPFTAMRRYYKAAYRSGCKKGKITGAAARWYRNLDRRYMSYVTIKSTPPGARIVRITTKGENQVGKTPWVRKRKQPGRYRFKIRLYDHKTVFLDFKLRPGQRLVKDVKMVKGDDPISRPENVDVAPPPPIGAPGNNPEEDGTLGNTAPEKRKKPRVVFEEDKDPSKKVAMKKIGDKPDDRELSLTKRRKVVKPGPPLYKQAWFWIVVGSVVTGTVLVAVLVPKDQTVNVGQVSSL